MVESLGAVSHPRSRVHPTQASPLFGRSCSFPTRWYCSISDLTYAVMHAQVPFWLCLLFKSKVLLMTFYELYHAAGS